jgi:hypothetical protein
MSVPGAAPQRAKMQQTQKTERTQFFHDVSSSPALAEKRTTGEAQKLQ